MNLFAGCLRGFVLAVLALAFLAHEVRAAEPLIDRGDSTYDPNTGLEWLDLRFTQGQSYDSIRNGWGDFTTTGGYRFATADELRQLFFNAGAKRLGSASNPPVPVNFEAAKLALSLLGTTLPSKDSNRSWMFYDPASDESLPSPAYVPTATFGEGWVGAGYTGREGFFMVPGLYPTTGLSSPEWASALVRVAREPVRSILLYANDFEAGSASLDGLTMKPSDGGVLVTVEAGQLKIAPGESGIFGVSRDLRTGNPLFKQRLPVNHGLLTWSFNVSNQDGRFNNNFDFVLASSHADPFNIAAHGYALRGGGMVGNRMLLWRFSNGLGGGGGEVIDIPNGLGTLPQKGSFRVTFDPQTRLWSLYGNIGANYTDPGNVQTLLGSGKDNTHIEEALPFIGLFGKGTGAGYFDNVRVSVIAAPNPAPFAAQDLIYLTAVEPVIIYPLANDEDPEGGPLHLVSVTEPRTGTVEIIRGVGGLPDAVRYTPPPGASATRETLIYTVAEEDGATSLGEIVIAPVPTNFSWPPIELFLMPGETAEFSVVADVVGDNPWRIAGIGAPERGTLDNGPQDNLSNLGRIRYTPPEGAIEKDRFIVTVAVNNLITTREVRVQRPPTGRFEGLFKYTGLGDHMEGRLRVNLSAARNFTAVVQLRGKTKRIRGQLSSTGFFQFEDGGTLQMWRDEEQLAVRASLPGPAGEGASEPGNNGVPRGWIASADRVTFGEAGDLAGRYTLVLPAPTVPEEDPAPTVPVRGHGWGVLHVFASGGATMTGATGDGKRWSSNGILRQNRTMLVYGAIKRGKRQLPGSLAGILNFRQDGSNSGGDGLLHWLAPSSPANGLPKYTRRLPILVSRYVEPAPGALPLAVAAGSNKAEFSFSTATLVGVKTLPNGVQVRGREFHGSIDTMPVTLSSAGFIGTASSTDGFSVRAEIRPRSGVFKGFFQAPESRKWRFFKGVIFQKKQSGQGAFMGDDKTGAVSLRLPAQ